MTTGKSIISKTPNLLLDYIFTDSNEYFPYFMSVAFSDLHLGIGEPKFFSFNSKDDCFHYTWGYKIPGQVITSLNANTRHGRWWDNPNTQPTKMGYINRGRGGVTILMNSLFLMEVEMGASNILLVGVVKEEDAIEVKKIYLDDFNDGSYSNELQNKLQPFIEIWIADDFDVVKSKFSQTRNLYRRVVRRILINNNFRIKLKPRAELNNLFIKRDVKFSTIDLLHTKINTLCQTAAQTKLLQLESQTI